MEKLYGIKFADRRERQHVVIVKADNNVQALERLYAYAEDRHDIKQGIVPKVVPIFFEEDEDDPTCNHICMVWHEDYD